MPEVVTIGSTTAAKQTMGFNVSLLKGGTITQTIVGAIISGMVIASTVATILMVSLISYQNPIAVDDTASTYKNVALSINVLSNDYDPKGNNISLVQVLVSPSYGSASISSNSLIVYKSNGTYAGNDTFSYQITNGYLTANATVVVSVVNRPPEAIPIAVTVSKNVQNTLINIFSYVGDNDEQISDPDSVDTLTAVSYSNQTIVSGTEGGYGTIKIDSYNGYYYSPASGFNGVEQFVYTISDGYDTSSSTITVTVANDAPTAVDDSYKIPKYASLVLDVLANDYDVNGDDFNITSALGTGYGAVSVSDKSITYITAGSVSTKYTDSFEYTISDGVATSSAIVIISVYNQVPVVYSKTVTVAKSSTNNSISIDYYDADRRDLVTVSTISPSLSSISPIAYLQLTTSYNQLFFDCCEWLTVETNNYTILFTPTTDTVYTQTFTVVLSDGEGTGTGTITIQVVNTPPVAVDDSAQCNKNQQVYVNLVANDYDENSGDTAKIKLTSTGWNSTTLYGGSLTIFNSTHALYVAPSGFLGTDSATYVITDQSVDSSGNADSTSFSSGKLYVTVINNAPTPVDDSFTISKGVTSTLSVLDNDTDPNDGSGSIYIINSVTASSVKNIQASIVATSGARDTLSYVASNAEYTDYLTYDVKDQDGMKSTYKATVTLYVINDAPVAVDDAYSTLWNRSVDCSVKSNDSDKNGDLDDSTISITTSPSHGTVNILNSVVRYTPTNGYVGTDTFTYRLNDGSSLNADSNIATVIITVYNNAPVTADDYITTHWRNPSGVLVTPLSNDSDPDGDDLIVESATASSSVGTVTVADTATIKFVPTTTSATTGTKSFTYYAYDYNKKTLGTVYVNITNIKPTANGESYTLHWAASATSFSVMDNDVDADSDTISLYSVSGSTAAAISGSYIKYTPKKDGVTDSFQYVITDTVTPSNAATVTVSFTNSDTPSASNVATSIHWRTLASQSNYQDFTVMSSTTDADGDSLTLSVTTTASGLSGSSCSKTSDSVPKVRTTAPTKTVGTVACSYSVSDGLASSGTKTATLTITNNAPTCSNMTVSFNPTYVSTGQNYSISSYVTDADSNDIPYLVPGSATIVGSSYSGDSFTVVGSYLNFKPNSNLGTRTYAYTVTDGLATSSKCYISIIVSSLSSTNYYQSYDVHWNASNYEVPILTNLPTSTIKAIASQSYSTVTLSGGKIYFTPLRQIYVDTFTVTVTDTGVDSPVSVTITTYNNVPTASLSTQTITWGSSKTLDLLTNYADDDYTAGRESKGTVKSIDTSSTLGSVSSVSGSSVTYTSPSKYVGSDTFKVTATDGLATVTFTVTLTMTNTAPVTNTKYFNVHWATHKTGYQMDLSTGVTDAEGNTLTYSVTSSSISPTTAGSVALSTSPYAVATASSTVYLGAFTFTYGASDSIVSTPGTVSVTVYNNMSTPVASTGSCHWKQTGVTLSPFSTFAPTLKDGDGDSLSLVSASAQKGSVSVATSTITYNAPGTYVGTDVVTYKFTDGAQSLQSTDTVVNVNVYNTAPVCVDKTATTLWTTAVTVDLSSGACTDADTLDTAYFNGATSSVVGGSVSVSSKKVTYTPSSTSLTFSGSSGYYTATGSFQFQCTDGMSTAASAGKATITVYNNAPTGTGNTVSVNRDYTTSTYDFTWATIATATDADGDSISYTNFASSDSTITVSNIGTGIRLTTSNKLVSGTKYITFKLYDGLHYSTSTLTFTVTFVNTAPACVASSVALNKKGTVDLSTLYSATDANSDPVTYAVVSSSVSSTYGSLSGTTFTASSTTSGSTTISYTATDSQATTTCSISVVISNQIPVADDITYQIVPVSTNYVHKFTYTATDGDSSDTLTYSQSSTTCSSSLVTALNITTAGLITFVRKSTAVSGTCTMTLLVVDNNSPTAGQDTAVVTFVISSSSPAANDDRFSINQGQTIRIYNWQILQNDYDEFGSNTTLTLTSISCPSSSYCHETPRQVTVNGLDAIELDSDTSTCQADSFQYTMKTSLGTTKTATVYVEFKNCYCSAKIDFLFLLDSSGSIGSTNFNKMRSLAKSITGRMSISSSAIMVAIAKFHSNGTLALALSSDGTTINNTLTNMAYEAGNTATIPGLRVAVDALRPANGGRADADKVIFILTDGLANVPCSCSSCVSEYQAKPSVFSNSIQTNILGKYTGSALTTQLQNLCKYQYTDSTVLSGTTCSYCSTSKTAYCLPCSDAVPIAEKINTWQRNSTGIVPYDLDNPYNGNNNVQWKIVAMAVGDAMSNTYGARQIEGMNYDPSRAMTVSWTDLDSTMSEIVDQSCNQVSTSDAS